VNRKRHFNKAVAVACLFLSGCKIDFAEWDFKKAEDHSRQGQFSESIKKYQNVIKRSPESHLALKSARAASRIAIYETKNFSLAIGLLKFIVLHSQDENERKLVQKEIADLYFDKLGSYQAAISEYNQYLTMGVSQSDFLQSKLRLAKSHFFISEFFQAESEVREALRSAQNGEERFELENFLANVLMSLNRAPEAEALLRKVITDYPDLAKRERVFLTLVSALEEREAFEAAIATLEAHRPSADDKEFVDLKISKLKERMRNRPGARGLRK
jgi:tetratricopeptide (TPR) repeat protein